MTNTVNSTTENTTTANNETTTTIEKFEPITMMSELVFGTTVKMLENGKSEDVDKKILNSMVLAMMFYGVEGLSERHIVEKFAIVNKVFQDKKTMEDGVGELPDTLTYEKYISQEKALNKFKAEGILLRMMDAKTIPFFAVEDERQAMDVLSKMLMKGRSVETLTKYIIAKNTKFAESKKTEDAGNKAKLDKIENDLIEAESKRVSDEAKRKTEELKQKEIDREEAKKKQIKDDIKRWAVIDTAKKAEAKKLEKANKKKEKALLKAESKKLEKANKKKEKASKKVSKKGKGLPAKVVTLNW